ncbi:uncharacterized protein [Rutidosis leptorrhynchoides]|uniref:uncharacterized protein n=1 Tax=Rutidosis leptorrhynchoides TaxID=125765 RepID=UPI003A98EBEB
MKKGRKHVVLLKADKKGKIVSKKAESEDMVVDLGFNGVVKQSSDTCDQVMEDVTLDKSGNGPVVEGSRKPSNEATKAEVVGPNVERRTPKWSKSLIRKERDKLKKLVKVGTGEGNVDESIKYEEHGNTRNKSFQSIIEVTMNDAQNSKRSSTVETVKRATDSVKEGTDAGLDSTKVLDSVIKVDELVAVENLAAKDEAHEDENSEIGKEERSESTIEADTDIVRKINDELKKEPQIIEEEIDVADKKKELEIGLTKEVADADHVIDETTEKKDEVSESLTVANVGSEEDDVEVVEEGLEEKDEVHEVVNSGTEEILTTERSELGITELDDVAATDDDDAGMDIDEVLGWKDELDEQKVDPTNLSTMDENVEVEEKEIDTLEAKQLYETAVSFHQSRYFLAPENEGEFSVFDLVWGKIRSYPWWPGQIFDPSDASEKAMKHHKKDCFLVAYFGDRTCAWNESTALKPFRSTFSQIANRTNSEAFNNAVHCALQEVSRRVELGLACSCIPREIYENIKCQIVENAGIKQESSKRQGIDKSASVNSFEPDKLVDYVRLLAKFPYGESDKMELTMAIAQLSSYGRYKRYCQLAEFQLCGDISEADQVMNDATFIDDGSKKRKALDSISDEPVETAKPSFKVGACSQKVESQQTGPLLKGKPVDQVVSDQAQLLSQLYLAARDPIKGHDFLNTIVPFFNSHRAAILNKIRQDSVNTKKRKASNENDLEEFGFDDYWTDRIVQNNPNEQLSQEHQNGDRVHQTVKPTRRSNKKRFFSSNYEIEAKEQLELIERRRLNLETELLMKFTEGIYFPSEVHLNKIFKRFGPLMESETKVDRQNGRARVVFKKCSDAEVAHNSAGKFNIFGSILVNFELNYTPLISYKPCPLPPAQDTTDAC